MVSPLVYYQLAFFALVWLFVMVPVTGSKPGPPTPPAPAKPKRQRSTEPKAFVGLTHRPPCVLGEQATVPTTPPAPVRPDPMPPTNRRPREVDTSRHFCPHANCDSRGWVGLGNLRANGHPNGGPWRQCPYGQNIRTRLPIEGYTSTIACPLACLPLPCHPYSASRGIAKPEGETMDWKHLLASITGTVDQELLLRNEYLVTENRMLRNQITRRVRLTDAERKTLAEIGHKLGKQALAEVATIVKPDTILGWHRTLVAQKFDGSQQRRFPGRPKIAEELEALIVRIAQENRSWGYDRIVGALANLGVTVSAQTVGNVLRGCLRIPPASP
jgi:hypothetical protein